MFQSSRDGLVCELFGEIALKTVSITLFNSVEIKIVIFKNMGVMK